MTNEEILKLMSELVALDRNKNAIPDSYHDGLKLSNGYFKFCYIFQNEDFVVKFARYNKGKNETICAQELANYEKAVEMGVEKALLKIEYIGEVNGIKFYKQEKVEMVYCDMRYEQKIKYRRMTKTIKREILRKTTNITSIDALWLGVLISLYGKSFGKKFAQWLKIQQVTDLHDANLGFKNYRPVIFDYGGLINE